VILKPDCRHFPGDRPCVFNKKDGVTCDRCPHYETAASRILIVKLDAVGDVLRTTCILHGLHETYPGCEITWITRAGALPLFENNGMVHRVFAYESTEAVLRVIAEEFDLVINLDAAPDSAVLASGVKGKQKLGYGLDPRGHVYPFNREAEHWLEMGAFDQVKKQNTRSYQDLMLAMCRLTTAHKEIVLRLTDRELAFAAEFAGRHRINPNKPVIGMNTGASGRWQYKQWTLEGYEALVQELLARTDATILLYGGPLERERNDRLRSIHPMRVLDTGTSNTLRQFFALVTLSDLFVTGDTLALHVATALGKKVVAYFGPTSGAEIDSYGGQIVKVQSDLDCLVCYKPRCDFDPNCMSSIAPEKMLKMVMEALKSVQQ